MSDKSIIEKLGIDKYGYHTSEGDMAIWNESDDIKRINAAAPEMLDALIDIRYEFERLKELAPTIHDKLYLNGVLAVVSIRTNKPLEKATGKSWEEIKELL